MKTKITLSVVFILMFLITLAWHINNAIAGGHVVTDGLLSYWTFDNAHIKDNVARDVWGGRDGNIFGGPQIVGGKFGNALKFNGINTYVEFEDAGLPSGKDKRTREGTRGTKEPLVPSYPSREVVFQNKWIEPAKNIMRFGQKLPARFTACQVLLDLLPFFAFKDSA